MIDSHGDRDVPGMDEKRDDPDGRPAAHTDNKKKKSLSMHEDVPVWYDCCSCEAEPYWLAVAEERDVDRDECENGSGESVKGR